MKLFDGWTDEEKKDWLMREPDDCDITAGCPEFFLTISDMVSLFAMWAIRQSPYVVPDRLTSACEHFSKQIRKEFKDNIIIDNDWVRGITKEQLTKAIDKILLDENFQQTKAWNTKVKSIPACNIENNKRDPDCDFIDIHALARNVSTSIWKEGWQGIDLDDLKETTVKDPSCQ